MHGKNHFYPELESYIAMRVREFHQIPAERQSSLRELARYVESHIQAGQEARLVFICTHNSRRSQMAQVWAQTAARYYGIARVQAFSGGTEATAVNPRTVAAMERSGFRICPKSDGPNPRYEVRSHDRPLPIEVFSKVYGDPPNPRRDFCAVMTCSQADENCPLVYGASRRLALPYEDPRVFDGTDQEVAKYDERCRQISREILYVFSLVRVR